LLNLHIGGNKTSITLFEMGRGQSRKVLDDFLSEMERKKLKENKSPRFSTLNPKLPFPPIL
jgi:hypothetical protein